MFWNNDPAIELTQLKVSRATPRSPFFFNPLPQRTALIEVKQKYYYEVSLVQRD